MKRTLPGCGRRLAAAGSASRQIGVPETRQAPVLDTRACTGVPSPRGEEKFADPSSHDQAYCEAKPDRRSESAHIAQFGPPQHPGREFYVLGAGKTPWTTSHRPIPTRRHQRFWSVGALTSTRTAAPSITGIVRPSTLTRAFASTFAARQSRDGALSILRQRKCHSVPGL
jgi:hypothetical protein